MTVSTPPRTVDFCRLGVPFDDIAQFVNTVLKMGLGIVMLGTVAILSSS